MRTLADGYPGDAVVLAGLEGLALIALLVGLAWAAERIFARRRAALRSALWQGTLLGVLLAPALVLAGRQLPWHIALLPPERMAPLSGEQPSPFEALSPPAALEETPPGIRVRGQPRAPGMPDPSEAPTSGSGAVPVSSRAESPLSGRARLPAPHAPESNVTLADGPLAVVPNPLHAFVALVCLLWGLGTVYLAAHLVHGGWRLHRLLSRLHPLKGKVWAAERGAVARMLSLVRLPELCISPDVRCPLVVGLLRPRVVLPEALLEHSSSEQVRAILVHECAHVVRRDPWVCLLQRLATVVFWVHPLVHVLNRRLNQAREEVCDNHVLAHADGPTYAETLLAIAQLCYPAPRLQGYLTMMPRHYNLERRVADLLEERRDTATRLPSLQRVVLLLSFASLLVLASSVGLHGAAQAEDDKGKAASSSQAPARPGEPGAEARAAAVIPLRGTVLAANGSPAAGAVVWAAKLDYGPLERRETVADQNGRYVLKLDPGQWIVWARRGTQGAGGPQEHLYVTLTPSRAPDPLRINLEERGTFRGRLFEVETGKPIVGGRLFLDAGLALTTGADGRFEVGGLSRDGHESFVVAPGRMRIRVLFDTTGRADTELEVPVPRAGKIVGRVTDRDGKPIPGAYVGRSTSGSFTSLNGLFQACDADGRFAYDDAVPPGQPSRLKACAPGHVDDEREGLRVPSDGKPLEIHFQLRPKPADRPVPGQPQDEARRIVSGTVRGPDGKPREGVLVRWGYQPHVGAIETRTDAAGRFRLTVPDKADMLAVLPREYLPEFPSVAAGGDQSVHVTLREGHSAHGRVVDDTGKPIKGVQVIAVTGSPDPRIGNPFWLSEAAVHTGADGKFVIKGVPEGARFDFIKAGMSDLRNHKLPLDDGETPATVTLSYGGAIKGRVVDSDDRPIRNFRVLLSQPRNRRPGDPFGGYFAGFSGIGVRFTSPDGSFVLTGVVAGSVLRISALAEGHGEAVEDRVTAVPLNRLGETEPVTLRAGPPVSLRVRAVTTDGKPIAGARVTLINGEPGLDRGGFSWGYHDASWWDMVRGSSGADGWAAFPALSFGGATVLVQAPGYARHRWGWRDGEKEMTFELNPECALTGELRDAAGGPLKEGYVNLMSAGDQVSTSIGPDDKGRFRIGELPAGQWTLVVRGSDGLSQLHQEQVTLKAGETKELKIATQEATGKK
jgi:beta-lactamase regulating signal transducer with metallopeptidase domain